MPAIAKSLRATQQQGFRMAISALVLAFLGSVVGMSAVPAEANDLPRRIAATRSGQVATENVMRAADREIRSAKRSLKKIQRTMKKAKRKQRAAAQRRREAKRELTTTRTRLKAARASLAAASHEPPPPPDAATAILALGAALSAELEVPAAPVPTELVPAAPVPADRAELGIPGLASSTLQFAMLENEVTAEDVTALEKESKQQKRAYKKAKKRARRTWRNVRTKRNRIAAFKARQRAAISRREGAEAALGYRILSMSRLARARLANMVDIKRVIGNGFVWPARGSISQTYGCTGFRLNPSRGSCRHFHDGLDIVSYSGAPIRAAAVGVVTYIGWNPWDQHGRAFMIVVAHAGGYETLYGHVLPKRQVRIGQLVRRGQVIGYMGNTGRSTGTHLHFELRRGRTTLNPLGFL